MKSALFAVALVLFVGGSAFACGGVHGDHVAAAINSIFGQHVADGEAVAGDHKERVSWGGDYRDYNYDKGTEAIQWLLDHGAVIPTRGGGTVINNNVHEG